MADDKLQTALVKSLSGRQRSAMQSEKSKGTIIPIQVPVVPEGWKSHNFQSAHEGGKVVISKHRPPLPPGKIAATDFC